MKEKILIFALGVLIGAIITTAGFMIYNNAQQNNAPTFTRGEMNLNGEMPSGDMPQMQRGDGNTTIPEKPENNNNNI